jgi:hypothetical protein
MDIALDQMTVPEKIQLMEALWADLSLHAETVELPAWHGQVLHETGQRVATGKEPSLEWEVAKRELRERFP